MKNIITNLSWCGYHCPYNLQKDSNPDPFSDATYELFCNHPMGKFWIYKKYGVGEFPEACPLPDLDDAA